ncbi:hypothetical protein LT40_12660 [Pseudomonas rhizosphaerae]|uniref:Uncharacterized protein n=1 Tax=Pseudomonas rhizosphaerae TaxID=216142 RepID=A0A089YWQ7_9PSED|nr:hypothetical protein LT40_12660 [Pseudomonas rhizosphaerae]
MHQAIVDDEVQRAVGGHASADPFQRMQALSAQGNQHDRQPREHHRIQVVLLEPAGARLVVGTVPAPAPTMHEVFVGQVGNAFHGRQRDEENQTIEDHCCALPRRV